MFSFLKRKLLEHTLIALFSSPMRSGWRRADRWRLDWRQRATWGLLMGFVVALGTLLVITGHPLGASPEYDTLDYWFTLRRPPSAANRQSRRVAILAGDQATLHRWQGRIFDAPEVGKLLRLLKQRGVAAAALGWSDMTGGALRYPGQETLARDMKAAGIAHLPLSFDEIGRAG